MKRIMPILMIALLLFGLFAGCSKKDAPEVVNLPDQTTGQPQTGPKEDQQTDAWQAGEEASAHAALEVSIPQAEIRKAQSYQEVYQLFASAFSASGDQNRDPGVDAPSATPDQTGGAMTLGFDRDQTVKTDGNYLYILTSQELLMISAQGENARLAGTCAILGGYSGANGSEYAQSLYLAGSSVYVLTNFYSWSETKDENGHYTYNSSEKTLVKRFDVSDPASITLTDVYAQDGRFVDARVTEDQMYLVTNFTAWNSEMSQTERYIPSISEGEEEHQIAPENLLLVEPCQSAGFTVLGKIDLATGKSLQAVAITGAASQVLLTGQDLYVALGAYEWLESEPYTERQYKVTDHVQLAVTRIFCLNPQDLSVETSGAVKGFLLSRYAMSEWNGTLRVVTNEYQYAYKTYVDETYGFVNYLDNGVETGTILRTMNNSELEPLGELSVVGEFGSISAVQYREDRAFFLTKTANDPGFVVDLSNAKQLKLIQNVDLIPNIGYLEPAGSGNYLGLALSGEEGFRPYLMELAGPSVKSILSAGVTADSGYAIFLDEQTGLLGLPSAGSYQFYDLSSGDFQNLAELEMNSIFYKGARCVQSGDVLYLCTAASVIGIRLSDYQILCSLTFANG